MSDLVPAEVPESQRNLTNMGRGRPRGSLNRTTVAVKEALTCVYRDLQESKGGDHAHFRDWAENHPTEFYRMMMKLLPMQARLRLEGEVVGAVIFKGLNDGGEDA